MKLQDFRIANNQLLNQRLILLTSSSAFFLGCIMQDTHTLEAEVRWQFCPS